MIEQPYPSVTDVDDAAHAQGTRAGSAGKIDEYFQISARGSTQRREVVAEQAVPWGPIVCRATTDAERAGQGAATTAPIDESLADFA